MRTANLTITAAEGITSGNTIEVNVEYDDGYVAYATFRNGIRCYANIEGTVHWEERVRDPRGIAESDLLAGPVNHWEYRPESAIELSPELRGSMARAAHAGLVACGARRIS